MFHLKSIEPKGVFPTRFAVLVEPEVSVRNNEQLYEAVRKHGKAVIIPTDIMPDGTIHNPVTLTPIEFERQWKGD